MKILNTIGFKFNPEAKKILEGVGEVEYRDLMQPELREFIKEYEIIVLGFGLQLNKEIIANTSNLKIIATATTGVDHIDVDYARKRGITVLSLQGEELQNVTGTAELAFGFIIFLARNIPQAFDSVKMYQWKREKFIGHNLSGKTLGIVGLGRLGSMMAQYGKAFGMIVIAHDPNKTGSPMAKLVDFNTLLSVSDIVSIHTCLSRETENMFDENVFHKMKNSAYLINTARGAIVNEAALLTALQNKEIAGYATDVLALEQHFSKNFSNHPLIEYAKSHDNLIITPHIGGMTQESRAATDIIIAKKVQEVC